MPLTRIGSPQVRSAPEPRRVLIDVGDRHTVIAVRRGTATEVVLDLPLGARRTAEEFFRHDPPRPAELEAAIDAVEDHVTSAAGRLPAGSTLMATGTFAVEIRDAVAGDATAVVSLDRVEQLFQRLASASLGNPAARHGLPSGNSFVAAALILREFMHHLGFASVVFRLEAA